MNTSLRTLSIRNTCSSLNSKRFTSILKSESYLLVFSDCSRLVLTAVTALLVCSCFDSEYEFMLSSFPNFASRLSSFRVPNWPFLSRGPRYW